MGDGYTWCACAVHDVCAVRRGTAQSESHRNIPYTFTDKERDAETGYLHFDARNYIDVLGIWTGPDRLLDKYIYNSPYVYCEGNPIKFVDPDGRIIRFAPGTTTAQKEMFWQAVRYLDSHNCGGRFGQLKKSRYTYIINMNVEKSQFKPNEQTINWLPDQGLETDNGTIMSPATVLNHEMTHATHYDNAVEQYNKGNTQAFEEYNNSLQPNTSENYDSLEEESVITGIEQRTAQALGEVGPDQVTRTNHKGNPVKVESPISNKKVEE